MWCDLPKVVQLGDGSAGLSLNGTCAWAMVAAYAFALGLLAPGLDLLRRWVF